MATGFFQIVRIFLKFMQQAGIRSL